MSPVFLRHKYGSACGDCFRDAGTPGRGTSLGGTHAELLKPLQMSGDFVLHFLRFT